MNGTQNRKVLRGTGIGLVVLGLVLLVVALGFPPAITTTYETTSDGVKSTSSPGTIELLLYAGLALIGAVLIKASDSME